MLNDWQDRAPEPPQWRPVAFWVAAGAITGLLALNIASGILGNGWNW